MEIISPKMKVNPVQCVSAKLSFFLLSAFHCHDFPWEMTLLCTSKNILNYTIELNQYLEWFGPSAFTWNLTVSFHTMPPFPGSL